MARVLIIDSNQADRDLANRHLHGSKHEVGLASDAKTGLASIDRQAPDVVVLDSQVPGLTCVQLIQRIRGSELTTHAYVIVVSSRPGVGELTAAIQAGADDFMRKPIVREELLVRVGALERIRGWATKIFARHSSENSPLESAIPRLAAWKQSHDSIAKDIEALVGQPLVAHFVDAQKLPMATIGAQIHLTLPTEQTETRMTIGLDAATVPKLGEMCLGDPAATEDMMRDLLRELANTACGAFMRSAAAESCVLTCGLPIDLAADSFTVESMGKASAGKQVFVVTTEDEAIHIMFNIEVVAKALKRVNVTQLVEGMVVARDLHSEAGAMLIPGGTRLTSSHIDRLRRMLSPRVSFDVAEG